MSVADFDARFKQAIAALGGSPQLRAAPPRRHFDLPDTVTREAYSHEVSCAGFGPGRKKRLLRWERCRFSGYFLP